MITSIFFILLTYYSVTRTVKALEWDPMGYIIYCPCMGRFGNQVEHFLGSLGFAKALNRTLILPPWRTYKNEAFDNFFHTETVKKYHRVILAEDFMNELAPQVWPVGKRIGWCYKTKTMITAADSSCGMKEGYPFEPFWDGLNINFDNYEFFNISYDNPNLWKALYPGQNYSVLAFKGAPARFPVVKAYAGLQQYLEWSEPLESEADKYIENHFQNKKYIGIHLRNGLDWLNACRILLSNNRTTFMSSYQCKGFNNKDYLDYELCFPSSTTVIQQLLETISNIGVNVIYISTDSNPMLKEITKALSYKDVEVYHHEARIPQINLIILGKSDHFIGSCMSSFSAFVSRERRFKNLTTSFWNQPKPYAHNEL